MNTTEMTEMLQGGCIRGMSWESAMNRQTARLCWQSLPEHPRKLVLANNNYGSESASSSEKSCAATDNFSAMLRTLLWTGSLSPSTSSPLQVLHVEQRKLSKYLPALATVVQQSKETGILDSLSELHLVYTGTNDDDENKVEHQSGYLAMSSTTTTPGELWAAAESLRIIVENLPRLSKLIIHLPSFLFLFSEHYQECCFPTMVLKALARGLGRTKRELGEEEEYHNECSKNCSEACSHMEHRRIPDIFFRNAHFTEYQFAGFCEILREGADHEAAAAAAAAAPLFRDILSSLQFHVYKDVIARIGRDCVTEIEDGRGFMLDLITGTSTCLGRSTFLEVHHTQAQGIQKGVHVSSTFWNSLAILLESTQRLKSLQVGHLFSGRNVFWRGNEDDSTNVVQSFARIRRALSHNKALERMSFSSTRGDLSPQFWTLAIFPALVSRENGHNDGDDDQQPNSPLAVSSSSLHCLEMPAVYNSTVIRELLQSLPQMHKLRHLMTSGRSSFIRLWQQRLETVSSAYRQRQECMMDGQEMPSSSGRSKLVALKNFGLTNLTVEFKLGAFEPAGQWEGVQSMLLCNRFLVKAHAMLEHSLATPTTRTNTTHEKSAGVSAVSLDNHSSWLQRDNHVMETLAEFAQHEEGLSAMFIVVRGTLSLFSPSY